MAYIRIEQPSAEEYRYGQNRIAINRGEQLLIEQKSYRQSRKATDRTEKLLVEQKSYRQNRKATDRTFYLQKKMAINQSINRICISPSCAPADCGHGHMKLPVGQIK